jgi:hypothetical protein
LLMLASRRVDATLKEIETAFSDADQALENL